MGRLGFEPRYTGCKNQKLFLGTVSVDSALAPKVPRIHPALLLPNDFSSTLCVNPRLLAWYPGPQASVCSLLGSPVSPWSSATAAHCTLTLPFHQLTTVTPLLSDLLGQFCPSFKIPSPPQEVAAPPPMAPVHFTDSTVVSALCCLVRTQTLLLTAPACASVSLFIERERGPCKTGL